MEDKKIEKPQVMEIKDCFMPYSAVTTDAIDDLCYFTNEESEEYQRFLLDRAKPLDYNIFNDMESKTMIEKEIVEALEVCAKGIECQIGSEKCPLYDKNGDCVSMMMQSAATLIKGQKSQIEDLYVELDEKIQTVKKQKAQIEQLEAQIEQLEKKAKSLSEVFSDDDFQSILICAERYACGRRSYMPGIVIDYITPLLPELSDRTLTALRRDIDEAMKYNNLGDPQIDAPGWIRLLGRVEEESEKRKTQ